jgi:hypothetical protein
MNEDIALTTLNHLHMHYLFNLNAFPQSNFERDEHIHPVYKSLFFRSQARPLGRILLL